jgi:hypothetical protein
VTPLTVSEAARIIGVQPRRISDLLYARRLPDCDYPVVGGRRLIPRDKIEEIRAALLRASTSTPSVQPVTA